MPTRTTTFSRITICICLYSASMETNSLSTPRALTLCGSSPESLKWSFSNPSIPTHSTQSIPIDVNARITASAFILCFLLIALQHLHSVFFAYLLGDSTLMKTNSPHWNLKTNNHFCSYYVYEVVGAVKRTASSMMNVWDLSLFISVIVRSNFTLVVTSCFWELSPWAIE